MTDYIIARANLGTVGETDTAVMRTASGTILGTRTLPAEGTTQDRKDRCALALRDMARSYFGDFADLLYVGYMGDPEWEVVDYGGE